jgi:preprotein translocase subunit SecA
MLNQLDMHWKEHLAGLDYLRQGIHLRGYAQKNPKQEYKREAFEMFSAMLDQVKHGVVSILSRAQLQSQADVQAVDERPASGRIEARHADAPSAIAGGVANAPAPAPAMASGRSAPPPPPPPPGEGEAATPFVRGERKVGRNEPCPCGSGKKYKHCHGRIS